MFEINIAKLKGKIAERGYSYTAFAKACGIDRNTLTVYLKQPERMQYRVIKRMASILCKTFEEVQSIFFDKSAT